MRYSIVIFIICAALFVPAKAQIDNNNPTFLKPDNLSISPSDLQNNSQIHEISDKKRTNQSAFLCTKAQELAKTQHFEEARKILNPTYNTKWVFKLLFLTLIQNILSNRKIILGRR